MTDERTITLRDTVPDTLPEASSGARDGRGSADGDTGWRSIELVGRGTTYARDQSGPSPRAPTVVLLHGWTATGSLNWTRTIAALSGHYRVIALDHRGHGRGIRSDEPFTLESCADDAVALLDVLGVRTAIFVGYSMGGPIAQLIWLRHRDRVSGLVLCATAADFTSTPDHWRLVRVLAEIRRVIPRSVRLRVARPFLGGLVPDPDVRDEVLGAIRSHHERSIEEAGQEIRRFRSTGWIGEVDVPVVVIVTERDRLVRPALQRQLAESIPGARVIEIDAPHLAAFTQPDLTANAVAAACDAIVSPVTTTSRHRFGERLEQFLRGRRRRTRPLRRDR